MSLYSLSRHQTRQDLTMLEDQMEDRQHRMWREHKIHSTVLLRPDLFHLSREQPPWQDNKWRSSLSVNSNSHSLSRVLYQQPRWVSRPSRCVTCWVDWVRSWREWLVMLVRIRDRSLQVLHSWAWTHSTEPWLRTCRSLRGALKRLWNR